MTIRDIAWGAGMYATIVRCDLSALASANARRKTGRILATALATLPGFVTFVALDAEAEMGAVAVLCLFEEQGSMAAAEQVIARWQREQGGAAVDIERLGAGAVIAQRGL